jgi:two-component system sensor histidine kinase CpxA
MRLFVKIFLWFWATLVISTFIFVAITALAPEQTIARWRSSTADAVTLYAQSAAEEMDRYGVDALNNYFDRLQASGRVRAALLDENGVRLAGQVGQQAVALAPKTRLGASPEFAVSMTAAYTAERVSGPSGRIYVFAAELARGPVAGIRWGVLFDPFRWSIQLLVSAVICYGLALYLTRPVLRLRTTADAISAGNLRARADETMERRRDEIGALVRDFNHMAGRIESLVAAQRQLVTDISHELRSPLARLTVALALARKNASEQVTPMLDRMEREAERLNGMISNMLSLSRMEATAEPAERTPIDVNELLREVVADAQFEAAHRGASVQFQGDGDCPVLGHAPLLRSALENVVRNAIRYTAPGTPVEVSASCAGQFMNINVRDHGPGVPDAELNKLFLPFYRVENARDRDSGGTGLGLAITERVVRLHGGKVEARNHPSGGLSVEIQLNCTRS